MGLGGRWARRILLLGLVGVSPGLFSTPLHAQGALLAGRTAVELTPGPTPIPVSVEYELLPDPGAEEIELTLLQTGASRLLDVRAALGGSSRQLELTEIRPRYWIGKVPLPPGGRGGENEEGGTPHETPSSSEVGALSLFLSYQVEGGWEPDGRVEIPTLAMSWTPRNPHPRTFVAVVQVPEGLAVLESFPTSVVKRPRGAEGGPYELALQAIPAMLVLRVVEGRPPLLTLERVLDVLVVLTLLFMGGVGIRYLKGRSP